LLNVRHNYIYSLSYYQCSVTYTIVP
jgi:hypothetical protein